ncbi:hypothetical protein BDQ17DRAFT_1426657 [Cyathus striatus]|nr:hypothetical protein BDQ17DRAFT_1426657 [Cyathus striatus]
MPRKRSELGITTAAKISGVMGDEDSAGAASEEVEVERAPLVTGVEVNPNGDADTLEAPESWSNASEVAAVALELELSKKSEIRVIIAANVPGLLIRDDENPFVVLVTEGSAGAGQVESVRSVTISSGVEVNPNGGADTLEVLTFLSNASKVAAVALKLGFIQRQVSLGQTP